MLRVPQGKSGRQLQHQIGSVFQRCRRTVSRRKKGRQASLREAAAHQADDRHIGESAAYFRKLMCMAPVKGVVLADDTNGRHLREPSVSGAYCGADTIMVK